MALVRLAGMISLMMVTSGAVVAQQGTEAQREACTPDAFRLCMSAMPDSGRVESCLRAAGPRLSPNCYAVFNPPQTEQMVAQGRDRRSPRDVPQRDVQQRDRGYGERYDQSRDYQTRGPRDGWGGQPGNLDDD